MARAGGPGPGDRLQRRACDILSSLNVTSLSVAAAELKILHTLMATEAETEIERRFQRRVEGSKVQALSRVTEQFSHAILEALSRTPASAVLLAEMVSILGGGMLASDVLRRLSEIGTKAVPWDYAKGLCYIQLSLLQSLDGKVRTDALTKLLHVSVNQLFALANEPRQNDAASAQVIVCMNVRILLPLLGFVIQRPEIRTQLAGTLIKLMSMPWVLATPAPALHAPAAAGESLIDHLVALHCITFHGQTPKWYAVDLASKTGIDNMAGRCCLSPGSPHLLSAHETQI